jgi:hypothetical protein
MHKCVPKGPDCSCMPACVTASVLAEAMQSVSDCAADLEIAYVRCACLQSVYVKKGEIFFKSTHTAAATQVNSEC